MRGARLVVVVLLLAFIAWPFAWTLWASLMPEARLFSSTVDAALQLESYRALFVERGFLIPLRNSLIVAVSTTSLALALGIPCAYAIVRLPLRGAGVLLGAILAVSVLPQIAAVGPLFLLLRALHLVDTFPGLILPDTAFALPLCIWSLAAIFRAVPKELEEAARVDGASRVRALWDVVLPVAAPGLVTTAILVFVACWNELLFALSFTVSPERRTVPVAIALLRGQHQVPWGQILAASIVASLPVAALVLAFQRRIVAGLTAGAVKG